MSNTPTAVIGLQLGRSKAAIYIKASKEGIRLMPNRKGANGHKTGDAIPKAGYLNRTEHSSFAISCCNET